MIDYIDVFKENIELTQENKYLQKKLDEFEKALEISVKYLQKEYDEQSTAMCEIIK